MARTFEVWPDGELLDEWCDKRLIEADCLEEAAELYWKAKCSEDPDRYAGGRVQVRYFGGYVVYTYEVDVEYDPVFYATRVSS